MGNQWNETVYFVRGLYKSYGAGGFYAWGNTALEALRNAKSNGAQPGDPYECLLVTGDFVVSDFTGCLTCKDEGGKIERLTPSWGPKTRDECRAFPRDLVKEAAKLESLTA